MLSYSYRLKPLDNLTRIYYCTSRNAYYRAGTLKEMLTDTSLGKSFEVNGWIKTHRHHKKLSFIHLIDGASSEHLQVILPQEHRPENARNLFHMGTSVKVFGQLVRSVGSDQPFELQASKIEVLGECDALKYPLTANNDHTNDYIRSFMHLRSKQQDFATTLRLRSMMKKKIHDYFHERHYIQIDTGIITRNECEGGSEALEAVHDRIDSSGNKAGFFGDTKAYLTVSGQLHLEAANSGISRVYTFGPTFRADRSHSRVHLSEFYMLEAELAFIEKLDDLIDKLEDLIKFTLQQASDLGCISEVAASCLNKQFHRISYTDAIFKLQKSEREFTTKPQWGDDLSKQHERALTEILEGPVFVTDWPVALKPFYMLVNSDEQTVACLDLLMPGVGELVGGSLREHRFERLESVLNSQNLLPSLEWYLDLRRFGSVPHGGYGLGFERLLQFLFGIYNIRDAIPFPRFADKLKM